MYKKGKKLDSKGIILACVGIIMVCIAINVAFAIFPPTGRTDDTSAVESSAASDGEVGADGHSTDDESEGGATDDKGETTQVDPSIVGVPDNLPEEMTQAGFQDVVARYLTSLTPEYGVPEKTLIESSDVNGSRGLRHPLLGHPRLLPQRDGDSRDRRLHQGRGLQRRDVLI